MLSADKMIELLFTQPVGPLNRFKLRELKIIGSL